MKSFLSFAACILLAACSQSQTEIVAWPGMEVEEFNKLNAGAAVSLSTDHWDWIGINSPVTLVFRQTNEELKFVAQQQGGGIMIKSWPSRDSVTGGAGSLTVESIAFNIGDGMENIAEMPPMLIRYCERLADLAGDTNAGHATSTRTGMPSALQLSEAFDTKTKRLTDVTVCSGTGRNFTFAITATHVPSDRQHGESREFAFLKGALFKPVEPQM